ncbi:MAG: class I SAM-dependent methyltransferase [Actinomycetota bacterium]
MLGRARRSRALELGVGTGRVALPLAAREIVVDGIDASDAMLERLAAADPDRTVSALKADFCDFRLPDRYDLIYCLYNAIFGLLAESDQLECFRCAAAHLRTGGRFVVQCFVPMADLGERIFTVRRTEDGLRISSGWHNPARQLLRTRQTYLRRHGSHSYELAYRYAYPTELDRMAGSAGLELEGRWADWAGSPFDSSSSHHVSAYRRRPAEPGCGGPAG